MTIRRSESILYIVSARLPTQKAHGYQIMKMCEAFGQIGINTNLLYPHRVQPKDFETIQSPCEYYKTQPSFEMTRLYCWDWYPWLHDRSQRLWFLLQAISFAVGACRYTMRWWQVEHTIFYSRDMFIMALLLQSRRFIRAKLVFEAHIFPGEKYRSKIISLFQHLDKLIVITHQLKRLFIEAGMPEDKIIVASDAVDLDQFQIRATREECRQQLGLPLDRPIIGYVGRFQTMGMEKGIPELVRAMKYLVGRYSDNPPLLLCVGGPMDCVPHYEDIAKKHNIPREYLQFVDLVPRSQVPHWTKACDVVTIPFPWNEHMAYYTSPMKLFEYMVGGVPIVASDLPSLREILTDGENAVLVSPGDAKELALGIAHLLDEPSLHERLARRARQDICQYTWENRARHILQSVIANP